MKELNPHKKNMSCQACSSFEPSFDHLCERLVLMLLADNQVVFFEVLPYLLDGIIMSEMVLRYLI